MHNSISHEITHDEIFTNLGDLDEEDLYDNKELLGDAIDMSDQFSFSRNQLCKESGTTHLFNRMLLNPLEHCVNFQGIHGVASEMDKREAVMFHDRRELNDSPLAISAHPEHAISDHQEHEDLKNTGKINKENNSCSSPEHRHLWSGIIPMSVLIIIVPANWFKGVHQALKTHIQQTMLRPCYCSPENNRGVAEVVRLWTAGISGDGLRKLPHNSGLDRVPPDRARNIDMGTDHCLYDKHEAREGPSMHRHRDATDIGTHPGMRQGIQSVALEIAWEEDTLVHLSHLFSVEPDIHQADETADTSEPSSEDPHKVGPGASLRNTSTVLNMVLPILLATLCLAGLAVHGTHPTTTANQLGPLKNSVVNVSRFYPDGFPPVWHNDILEEDKSAVSRKQAEVKQNSCVRALINRIGI